MIRTATIEDANQIATVHVSSWRTTYAGQMPQSLLDGLSVPRREAQWRTVFHDSRHHILVAEDGGKIVGFSSFGPSRDNDSSSSVGELYAIYLIEDAKGRGIGTALWERTCDFIKQLGYSEVTLWVLDTNSRARNFYDKVGFTLDGAAKREDIGGAEISEVRYRLRVS